MLGGIGTDPAGPMPFAASEGDTGPVKMGDGEVSED